MAIELEKVTEKFYLGLEEGKILGKKCTKCGAVEFPPVYACNTCGCWDMEWYEISGNATLHSMVLPAALSSKPEYKALGKYCYGEVELEEGSRLNAVVRGINKKKRQQILDEGKLPVKIKAAIYQRYKLDETGKPALDEAGNPIPNYKTVVFDLVED